MFIRLIQRAGWALLRPFLPINLFFIIIIIIINKAISVTDRGGLWDCEILIPHCVDNRLTDGGKIVSPTHRPRTTHYFLASGTHFC
jgi:hypothetical protein